MMHNKLMLFGERDLADEVMKTTDQGTIKDIGRTPFLEFDNDLWLKERMPIMRRGLRAKFQQNATLLDQLLSTGDAFLAEAAPKDLNWGIGLSRDDDRAYDITCWRGENVLGKTLMAVRRDLRIWKGMKGDQVYHYVEAGKDPKIFHTALGKMSLIELRQLPEISYVVDSYANICVHYLKKDFADRDEFYAKTKDVTLEDIKTKAKLPWQGYDEMI